MVLPEEIGKKSDTNIEQYRCSHVVWGTAIVLYKRKEKLPCENKMSLDNQIVTW